MATLPLKFNHEGNKEGMTDFTALPAGEYPVVIVKSVYKATKAKDGHYLQLSLKVMSGAHKGKMLFENLNLDNPNPIAVEIANKTLNSICQACDKIGVEDSEELHNIPMLVTLKVVPATATNPASNSSTAFKPFKGELTEELPTVQSASTTAVPVAGEKRKLPWERN